MTLKKFEKKFFYCVSFCFCFQLVKVERVSHKEGVKTVISDVCFAPLTRLDPSDSSKLKHGLLPLLRFPIKIRQKKSKVRYTLNTFLLIL